MKTVALPEELQDRAAFGKPWHASIFALVLALHDAGCFDWSEWSSAFGTRTGPEPDGLGVEDAYFGRMSETLVALLHARGLATPREVAAIAGAWRAAYLATPHGQPIELSDALYEESLLNPPVSPSASHDHDHHHHHHSHQGSGTLQAEPVAMFGPGEGGQASC